MSKNLKYYPFVKELIVNQWFKNGDHPDDRTVNRLNDGKVVGRILEINKNINKICPLCKHRGKDHGRLNNSIDGERLVCPGDYIETIKESTKVFYRLHKKKIFERYFTTEPLDET